MMRGMWQKLTRGRYCRLETNIECAPLLGSSRKTALASPAHGQCHSCYADLCNTKKIYRTQYFPEQIKGH